MAQQPQPSSQYVFGPANGGGDILHIQNNQGQVQSWTDNNSLDSGILGAWTPLNGPAVSLTAATGGVFANAGGSQVNVYLPGNGSYEQVPFTVKASGAITVPTGTYTATVQPLIYALAGTNTAAAVVGNAVFSAAAVSLTITSASPITLPYSMELHLVGDSVSGKVQGWQQGVIPTGGATLANAITSPTIAVTANAPASIKFNTSAVPLLFAAGVVVGGGAPSGPTISLGSLVIES